ncbi:MAG TPA: phage tail protein [Gaiellales bacterium]|nr:phage tail protein [Gaiellales bacterium]
MSKEKGHRKHHSFRVSWDGTAVAGVDRVSPLVRAVDVITVRDGGAPGGGQHSTPGRIFSEPVTLERPRGGDTAFGEWAGSARAIAARKDVTVEVLNADGAVIAAYRLLRCWPSEYRVSLLERGTRAAVVEQLRLENDGWDPV